MFRLLSLLILSFCFFSYAETFDVFLSKQQLDMGDTLFVKIETDSPLKSYKCVFLNRKYTLFLDSYINGIYTYVAYLGASRYKESGDYVFVLSLRSEDQSKFYEHYSISLNHPPKKPGKVNLSSKAKKISKDVSSRKAEIATLTKVFALKTKKKYFSGPFIEPTKGRLSSVFGKVRHYNNGSSSSHSGVDFSNKIGTKVRAVQNGKVVLSESFKIHGNTIVIDHGYGVLSVYLHLNALLVKEGQFVNVGDIIAEMGATGLVSGPHLHWGLSLQSERVDPLKWTDKKLEFFSINLR